ncbi:hypothetical protein C7M84_018779 [Penaeus vannamei]|uniref:Uncharacterized protein n=1 Tax=Penaeus vannamei TaxID=6689 RepID=A0A3R7PYB8_PENVA|nr:hypothetical protein C7M84_018779 [Penaeus vannamei]
MALDPTRQRTRAFEVYNVGYEDEAMVQGEGGGRSSFRGEGVLRPGESGPPLRERQSDSRDSQYRPVYQTQHLGNSNLVPKPYVSRYSADRPYRAPVASPRTFLMQMEPKGEQKTKENKENEGVKAVRESKDTRGKVKKSPTTTPKETLTTAEKLDSAPLVKKPCPTRPAPSPTRSSPSPTRSSPIPPQPTQAAPTLTQPAPVPTKPALSPTQPVPIPIHPDPSRTQREPSPTLETKSEDAEPTLIRGERETTPHKDDERNPPSRRSRPNSLILTDAASPDSGDPRDPPKERMTRSLSPLDQKPPPATHDLGEQASRALSSGAAASEDSEKSEKTALYNCSNQPFNSFGELEALRSKSPPVESPTDAKEEPSKGEGSYDISTDDFDYADGSVEAINQLEDMLEREQADSPPVGIEAPTLLSAASVSTLSRDSLDGFLNDDMGSLTNFVTQKTLEYHVRKGPKPDDKKADGQDEGGEKESLQDEGKIVQSMGESVDFCFEEVEDSPTHTAAEEPAGDDENKGSKLSPTFSKFTQKVSDKNKENEEKSKSPSRFSPRNFLSLGNKDKNKSKSKSPTPDSGAKTEGWTTEAIEEYLVQNKKEETVRLGLMDEKDVEVHQAKKEGKIPSKEDLSRLPEVTVHEVVTIRPDSCCKKRPAPVPPQGKSSAWKPEDIENYLLEHNPDENLRLGLLSQEDIQIYEWKRATAALEDAICYTEDGGGLLGQPSLCRRSKRPPRPPVGSAPTAPPPPPAGMSPICDTSWTRETLRKNKVIRGSSSSSMSPPESDPPSPVVPRSIEKPEDDLSQRPVTPMAEARRWSSERAVDVPTTPTTPTTLHPKPPRRRARAPLPPSPARASLGGVSTPTRTSGHFAFRGFKLGQNVGISLLSDSITGGKEVKSDATSPAQERKRLPAPEPQPESKPEGKPEGKPESKPRRLALEKIGVRLPGMGGKEGTTAGTPPAAPTPQASTPTPVEDEGVQRRISGDRKVGEITPVKKETPYRKLARLLGKDVSPAPTPAPAVEVPAHALFLRESARKTVSTATFFDSNFMGD